MALKDLGIAAFGQIEDSLDDLAGTLDIPKEQLRLVVPDQFWLSIFYAVMQVVLGEYPEVEFVYQSGNWTPNGFSIPTGGEDNTRVWVSLTVSETAPT
jgi:DNA-binding transcriptional LysR family regulator